jgi:hypothetical protein
MCMQYTLDNHSPLIHRPTNTPGKYYTMKTENNNQIATHYRLAHTNSNFEYVPLK